MNWKNKNLKILNFTHNDMDGAGASIILRNYFNEVITYPITYGKENDIISKIKMNINKIDGIIFTDFTPENLSQIQSMSKPVMVIDHHTSALKYHKPENDIMIFTKYCGTLLTFKYFNDGSLNYLENMSNMINDYDLFILKDPSSKFYNNMYFEMGFKWFSERFFNGNLNLYPEEKDFLTRMKKKYDKFYSELPITELPNKGVFAKVDNYIADVSIDLRNDGYEWLILMHGNSLSLRSSNPKIDLTKVCEKIGKGGGHPTACGMYINNDNLMELVNKITKIVQSHI